MREIKFRGKCQRGYDYSNGDGWVYGSLLQNGCSMAIVRTEDIDLGSKTDDGYSSIDDFGCIPVIDNTVGVFLNITDKEGVDLFEYDVIKTVNGLGVLMYFQTSWGIASYANGYEGLNSYTSLDSFYVTDAKEWEVVGNIFDNPELLKSKED